MIIAGQNLDMILSMGALLVAWLFGVALAQYNLKVLIANKPERMAAYRVYKKEKNRKLAKALGVKYE